MNTIGMKRREFISLAGRATVLGLLGRGLQAFGADGAQGRRMRLSTSSVMFDTLPIEQVCERLARLKFDAIDIWGPFHWGGAKCDHLEDVANRLGADGLKSLLAKHQLGVSAFTCYNGYPAKYAKLLGAIGGGEVIRSCGPQAKPGELTAKMKEFFEQLKPEADLAAENNSRLLIENHSNLLLNKPDSFKAFVDLNKNPNVGIALAPLHLQIIGVSVEDVIAICGSQLRFFYAWQRGAGENQLPGVGPADFVPWLKALAKIKFNGFVNPFMHHHPAPDAMAAVLAKSRQYLLDSYRQAQA